VAYLLILFGALFLIATFVPIGGGAVLLGLGLAFLVARLTTGRYGYAVPAGILTGLGAFVAFQEAGALPGDDGGWALVFLGLGFLAIYPLGVRAGAYWPVIPGAMMIALGLAQLDAVALAPLAAYARVAQYWPVVLVLIGLWILARDAMSPPVRTTVGMVLVTALILAGALAMAAAAGPIAGGAGRPGAFGAPAAPLGQTTMLSAPIATGETVRITNATGGSIRVVPGDTGQVRAQVTRQLGWGPPATVDLGPGHGAVVLEARDAGVWPNPSPAVSLVVEAPRDAPVVIEGSSGDVTVADRAAAIQVRISSGSLIISRVDGPVDLMTSSGSIRAADVTGTFIARASSGSINATGLLHPSSVQTSSGSINLSGTFAEVTSVRATSGSIALGLAPDSSTRISASTTSGSVSTGSLPLANLSQSPHQLDGTLGSGAGTLTVQATGGSVSLSALR
jgi:hypothetical protein